MFSLNDYDLRSANQPFHFIRTGLDLIKWVDRIVSRFHDTTSRAIIALVADLILIRKILFPLHFNYRASIGLICRSFDLWFWKLKYFKAFRTSLPQLQKKILFHLCILLRISASRRTRHRARCLITFQPRFTFEPPSFISSALSITLHYRYRSVI
jgi:hypothetical protein